MQSTTASDLLAENAVLQRRLQEAEQIIRALRGEAENFGLHLEPEPDTRPLRASRAYHLPAEKMRQGAVILDPQQQILYCNVSFANTVKRPLHALVGSRFDSLVARSHQSHFEPLIKEGSLGSSQGEIALERGDGSHVPVYITVDSLDEMLALCLTITDLTESESRKRLEAFFALTQDAILLMDDYGCYVDANPAACAMTGYNREELLQRSIWDVSPPAQRQLARELWKDFLARGMQEGEYLLYRKDGSTALADYRAVANVLPGLHLSTLRDITARRRAEERLRASEEQFRAMFELAGVGKVQIDPATGRFLRVNRKFCEIIGYSAEEVHGKTFLELTHPDDRESNVAAARHLMGGETNDYVVDKRYIRKDGQVIWVHVTGTVVRDSAGRAVHALAVVQDITDRRRAEEALREADRRKDDWLAILGHELRNPLSPMRNAIEIVRLCGDSSPEVRQASEILRRQAAHMTQLLEDLLDVSRIGRGKVELRKEIIDIRSAIERAIETSRPLVESQRHILEVKLPSGPLWIDADPIRIAQVFANLLNNAAKYTDQGGRIWLHVERNGERVGVGVRDSGIGISQEFMPCLFEPFTQSSRATHRAQGGLGIGLALVRSLLELHGGSIQAFSPGRGQGSEFVVSLPISTGTARDESVRPNSAHGERAPRRALRILLLDDDRDTLESLALLLKMGRHEVYTSSDGAAALEMASRVRPDVAFLDIGLPGMSGYEVARRLRQLPELTGIVLVALTGYGQEQDRLSSREAGFDYHLVKPVEPRDLCGVLSAMEAVSEQSG
jgi:two-component system CheB/CheR fusion protein